MNNPIITLVYPGHLDIHKIAKLYKHTTSRLLQNKNEQTAHSIWTIESHDFNNEMIRQNLRGMSYNEEEIVNIIIADAFAS